MAIHRGVRLRPRTDAGVPATDDGLLARNPRLAFVQTPHHFYSPDPFQRNLAAGTRVPAEGNLFYGLLQDCNDFWKAAFFCGSCAVIRRAALASIGGFATQTVTEDAHTALRMHRKGWDCSLSEGCHWRQASRPNGSSSISASVFGGHVECSRSCGPTIRCSGRA